MRLPSGTQRPNGYRLAQPTNIKIKGLFAVPKPAAPDWSSMWTEWDWSGWIQPQIDRAITQGANTIKCTTALAAVLDGRISQATANARLRQFLDYAVEHGLLVYWNLGVSNEFGAYTDAQLQAVMASYAAVLDGYPEVVGIDVVNEWWDDTRGPTFVTAVKAQTSIPLTFSRNIGGAGSWTPPQVWAQHCDFLDYHPYYGPTFGVPQPGDLGQLRGSAYYKPWLIGELGSPTTDGQARQTAFWLALGVLAAEADSYGSVGFCINDYSAPYGMYDQSGNVRQWIADAFHTWPNVR